MKTKTKSVYYCEHCNKHGLSKHMMEYHEKVCRKNPDNFRVCFSCQFLHSANTELLAVNSDGNQFTVRRNLFFCQKRGVYVYPAIVEHKGNGYNFWEFENWPMMKECSYFENKANV